MKIATIASGVTTLANKEIETSVQSFAFSIVKPTTVTYPDLKLENALDMLIEAFGDTTITLSSENGESTETIYQKLKLFVLAELCANNGGVILIDYDDTANTMSVKFTVEISNDGAFKLNDRSKLILNIEGKPSDATMDIFALDFPVPAKSYLKYDRKTVNASEEKDFDVKDSAIMAMPIDTLDSVKIYYNNGRQIVMTKDELLQRLHDSEDAIINCNGRVHYGYGNYAVLNVEGCWKISVLTNSTDSLIVIKEIEL